MSPSCSRPQAKQEAADHAVSVKPLKTHVVRPSAGCRQQPRIIPKRLEHVSSQFRKYLFSVPPGYDGTKPLPLAFAFHGHSRSHEDCRTGDCRGFRQVFEPNALVVYLKSIGPGWEQPDVREANVNAFQSALTTIQNEHCVDDSRIIVAGTSSGARFVNLLACRFGQQLFAVAPVAGSMPDKNCGTLPSVIAIHGVADPWVTLPSGEDARDFFAKNLTCSPPAQPSLSELRQRAKQARESGVVVEACADYQACANGKKLRWCEHSEGGYDGSTHGWPSAGARLIWQFLTEI